MRPPEKQRSSNNRRFSTATFAPFLRKIEASLRHRISDTGSEKLLAHFINQLRKDSSNPEALFGLGRLLEFHNISPLAATCFKRLLDLDPTRIIDTRQQRLWEKYQGTALNSICIAKAKRGQYDQAVAFFARHLMGKAYGFFRAAKENRPCNAWGEHLPLYTMPTLEWLNQFDYSDKAIFEFGSGNSTVFWSKHAASVLAVETDPKWFEMIQNSIKPNAKLILADPLNAPKTIMDTPDQFDVVIVDGAFSRYASAKVGLNKLREGGMMILDNSDWHPNTAALIKQSGLIQVDFVGVKPTEFHASTTSVFLTRSFNFKTRRNRQPGYGLGSLPELSAGWDFDLDASKGRPSARKVRQPQASPSNATRP